MPEVITNGTATNSTATNGTAANGTAATFTSNEAQSVIDNSQHGQAYAKPAAIHTGASQAPGVDYFDYMKTFPMANALSLEGTNYLKDLTANLAQSDKNIKIQPLARPAASYVVSKGNYYILLLFSEALNTTALNLPIVAYSKLAIDNTKAMNPHANFLTTVVIDPVDYYKYAAMSAYIRNAFRVVSPEADQITIHNFKHVNLDISYDASIYDNFVRRIDPHHIPTRADIKMCVYLKAKQNSSDTPDMYQKVNISRDIMLAIGAYVTFVSFQIPINAQPNALQYAPAGFMGGGTREVFQPVIHVNFFTPDMTSGMMILGMLISVQQLIDNGEWKRPFRNIGDANGINIGNLARCQEHPDQPFQAQSIEQVEEIFTRFVVDPVIVLDAIDGRATTPEMNQLVLYATKQGGDEDANAYLLRKLNSFFTGEMTFAPNQDIVRLLSTHYTGIIGMNGIPVDSSYCDYLHAVKLRRSDLDTCKKLQWLASNPEQEVELVKQFYPDFKILFHKQCCVLNCETIREVQRAVARNIILPINQVNLTGHLDINYLWDIGRNFRNTISYGGNGASAYTPIGQLYR